MNESSKNLRETICDADDIFISDETKQHGWRGPTTDCPMCGEAPAKNDSICEDCTEYVNAPHM